MTTLQEYLNDKYPTPQTKAKIKEVILDRGELKITEQDDQSHTFSRKEVEKLEGDNLNLTKYLNLEKVKIDGSYLKTKLTILDVSNCSRLRELNCSNNQLTSLKITDCVRLQKLDYAYNPLWDDLGANKIFVDSLNFTQHPLLKKDILLNWKDIHEDFNNYSQKEWEKLDLNKEEVQAWIRAGFEPRKYREVQKWKEQGLTPQESQAWMQIDLNENYDHNFAGWLKKSGYLPEQAKDNLSSLRLPWWQAIHSGFTEELRQKWIEWFCKEEQITEDKENDAYQAAQAWITIGFDPTESQLVWWLENKNYIPNEERRSKYHNGEIDEKGEKQKLFQPNDKKTLKQEYLASWGFVHPDFAKKANYQDETYQKCWEQIGCTYQETQGWIKNGFRPRDYENISCWKKKGYTFKNYQNYAQDWLDKNYPKKGTCRRKNDNWNFGKKRSEIGILEINDLKLAGSLKLTEFTNLWDFCCFGNQLTELDISDCKRLAKINCHNNRFNQLPTNLNAQTLTYLNIGNNKFKSDLTIFSDLVNLKEMKINNNQFTGSLAPLNNLSKLKSLDIGNTQIDSGLEHLSKSLEVIGFGRTKLAKELKKYGISSGGAVLKNMELAKLFEGIKIEKSKIPNLETEILQLKESQLSFTEQEQKINYLETRVQELINLIGQRKEKIVRIFTSLLPDKKEEIELIQNLVISHLDYTKARKQNQLAVPLRKKRDEIRGRLEELLGDSLEEEIEVSLTDCEDLVTWELELDDRLKSKSLYIEEQKQILRQITYNPENQAIVQKHEIAHWEQVKRRNTVQELEINLAGAKAKLEIYERESKIILATNLPFEIYQFSLIFLKAKDYFYLARKNTIDNLQSQIQTLENKIKIIDKGAKISELIINIGNSTKALDQGITSVLGNSLKAGTNLLSSTYISQEGKQIHLSFQNSQEEIDNIKKLDFAYSQLNKALNGNKDYDLFGILDDRYHRAFKTDYHIYDILTKQINIWPDRSLNRERLEQIYKTLQNNLSELNQEINGEFCKLKSEDQIEIRKNNELKIVANQVKITDQDQKIMDLKTQIANKEKELTDLIISSKEKLKSNYVFPSKKAKRTQERHALLEKFLTTDTVDPTLNLLVQKKKVNMQEITNLKESIRNLQDQLNKLESEQLENKIVKLDINH